MLNGRENPCRVHIRDIADGVNECMLYELCAQFGPIEKLDWPRRTRDDIDTTAPTTARSQRKDFCYVDYACVEDAKYFTECMQRTKVKLCGNAIDCKMMHDKNKDGGGSRHYELHEIGAKLIVIGLDPTLIEFEITEYFEKFGPFAVPPRMIRDAEGNFVGRCILSFKSFDTADEVIQETDTRVFRDRIISVTYKQKDDGSGELHGTQQERESAALIQQEDERHRQQIEQATAEHQTAQMINQRSDTSWATAAAAQQGPARPVPQPPAAQRR